MTSRTSDWRSLNRSARAGITLVELMVAMVIVSMVVVGVYVMMGTSAEVFHHQELRSENQNNLRFATEILKQDLVLAGYHSTPNSAMDPLVCPKPADTFTALDIDDTQVSVPALPQRRIRYQRIQITGDFSGQLPMRIASVPSLSTVIISQQSLLDQLPDGATPAQASDHFDQLIDEGDWISVMNPDGIFQLAQVDSIDPATLQINLDSPLTRAAGSSCGLMGRVNELHEVYPIKAVRYSLKVDPNDNIKTNLVREEVDPLSKRPVNNTELIVAENVVGFELLAIGTDGLTGGIPVEEDSTLITLRDDVPFTIPENNFRGRGQRTRFMIYRIQTRTNRAIPRRLAVPSSAVNSADGEYTYFELPDDRVAEVRTLQGKLEIPNLILRGLQ